MPVVSPIPQQSSFGVPPGPVPFARKTWDNPIRYRLNRAYGDEFEYANLTQFNRRWQRHTVPDTSLGFPGGSSIELYPSSQGSAIYRPAPSGDFEMLLEYSGEASNNDMFGLYVVDANGSGQGCSLYSGSVYNWTVTTWNYSGSGNNTALAYPDTRHTWIALKKSGTSYTAKGSTDGATFSSYTSANTNAIVPVYIGIGRMYTNATGSLSLHRLNVYPGPTFFVP